MKGRMYDPEMRRFLTPDPFVTEPLNPQGLNRYSYVQNNPLSYVDPSGFEPQCYWETNPITGSVYPVCYTSGSDYAREQMERAAAEARRAYYEARRAAQAGDEAARGLARAQEEMANALAKMREPGSQGEYLPGGGMLAKGGGGKDPGDVLGELPITGHVLGEELPPLPPVPPLRLTPPTLEQTFWEIGQGLAHYGEGFGIALGHMAAREGLLGTELQQHAKEVDWVLGAGVLALVSYPEQAVAVGVQVGLAHPGYVIGRYGPVLAASYYLGPIGASMSALATYGTAVSVAQRGVTGTEFMRGFIGPF